MLLHETAKDYILFCRMAIQGQQEFTQAVVKRKQRHLQESHPDNQPRCTLCTALDDCLTPQYAILHGSEDRYQRAKKGIYE